MQTCVLDKEQFEIQSSVLEVRYKQKKSHEPTGKKTAALCEVNGERKSSIKIYRNAAYLCGINLFA